MKCKNNRLKKVLLLLNCVLIIAVSASLITMPAQAASYPSVFLDTAIWGLDANNYAGDVINLKFTYFPAYNNEKLSLYVYDSNGDLKATAERSFSNSYTTQISYTVTWNTAGYDPGDYKLVMEKHFYSFLEWRTAPTNSSWYVTLKDPGSRPSDGWCLENNKWAYYVNGSKLKKCWKLDSNGWCYLGEDGYMAINEWIMDSQGWCYVGANGYCVTNDWVKDSKGWVYLDASGRMVTNMWVKDSKGWCYVGADGYAETNCWKADSMGWCYLDSDGSMTKNDWVLDGGKWYYLDANGYMISNTTKHWNGKTYYFDASGVCTNP